MKLRWIQLKTGLQDSPKKLQYLEGGYWHDIDTAEKYDYHEFIQNIHKDEDSL